MIPTYFTNQKTNTEPVQDLMLQCLKSEDKDLIISASKYFGWVTNDKAGEVLLRNLDHSDWEVRALSARVSQRGYESPQLLNVLEQHLADSNWFVRMNSAYAFLFMVKDDERVKRILDGKDKYAREMIIYVMFVKGMIDYNEYVKMTAEPVV